MNKLHLFTTREGTTYGFYERKCKANNLKVCATRSKCWGIECGYTSGVEACLFSSNDTTDCCPQEAPMSKPVPSYMTITSFTKLHNVMHVHIESD